jgi:hypothetical protein
MTAAYSSAQGMGDRFLRGLGIDQMDPRYAQLRDDMEIVRSAAITGAKNQARSRARETSQQMRLAVAGMGSGIPMQSLQTLGNTAQTVGMAGQANLRGAAGIADANMLGARMGLDSANMAGNAVAANTQFLAERAFNQDALNARAVGDLMNSAGQMAGMAATMGSGSGAGAGAGGGGNYPKAGSTHMVQTNRGLQMVNW